MFFSISKSFSAVVLAAGLFVELSSLGFCTSHDHSFLYDKFPEIREQAKPLPYFDDDEDLLAETKKSISPDIPLEEFIYNECFSREGLFLAKAKVGRKGEEGLDRLADLQMARHRDTMPSTPFNDLYFYGKIDNPDLTVLEDLILTAEDIHRNIQRIKPDPKSALIFLGRSPCLYQVAMEELSKKCPGDINLPLIHINYSGHADALSKRVAKFYHGDRGVALNMVTKEKLDFYIAYLAFKKLQCYKQLFVIDIIGTGGGIRSWLGMVETLMHRMCLCMPKIHLFVLTPFVRTIAVFDENSMGFYKDATRLFAYSSHARKIIFDENRELNMKAMEVDATPIHISSMTQYIIDMHMLQRHCTHGFYFPAQMWTEEGYAIAKKGGDCHQKIYAQLRMLLGGIFDVYHEGLRKIESGVPE